MYFSHVNGIIIFSVSYLWILIEILLIFFSKESKGNKLNRRKETEHSTFLWHYFELKSVQKQQKVSIKKKKGCELLTPVTESSIVNSKLYAF